MAVCVRPWTYRSYSVWHVACRPFLGRSLAHSPGVRFQTIWWAIGSACVRRPFGRGCVLRVAGMATSIWKFGLGSDVDVFPVYLHRRPFSTFSEEKFDADIKVHWQNCAYDVVICAPCWKPRTNAWTLVVRTIYFLCSCTLKTFKWNFWKFSVNFFPDKGRILVLHFLHGHATSTTRHFQKIALTSRHVSGHFNRIFQRRTVRRLWNSFPNAVPILCPQPFDAPWRVDEILSFTHVLRRPNVREMEFSRTTTRISMEMSTSVTTRYWLVRWRPSGK